MTPERLKEIERTKQKLGRANGYRVHHMEARNALRDLLREREEDYQPVVTFLERQVKGRDQMYEREHRRLILWRWAAFVPLLILAALGLVALGVMYL